ncbi:hypothetical protein FHS96_004507 [Sphingomonas zeicaulis]|uniref:hypothetical protein n=1 Tax=Sphingomonas zeicaulis TaxID=1632740 RepID=UPI003D1D5B9F
MAGKNVSNEWKGATVRAWLESRIAAARADQVAAQRGGRDEQDDCDKASAEELVCSHFRTKDKDAPDDQKAFMEALRGLLDRETYIWRGVYDDGRFDRHVRSYIRKLIKMAKANEGFEKTLRYQ